LSLALPTPAGSAADGGTGLDVTINGAPVDATAALGPRDVGYQNYDVCAGGQDVVRPLSDGWSIAALIEAAGATPESTASVQIRRASTSPIPGWVTLTPQDFDPTVPGGLDLSEGPAFIYSASGPVYDFFRPYRGSSCLADANANDWVRPPNGDPLRIAITTDALLKVRARASTTQPTVGQPDTFSATVLRPPSGASLSYTWTFSDDTTAQGAVVTHGFPAAGTYQAVVSVTGSDRSGGTSTPLAITVGAAPGPPGQGRSSPQPPTVGGPTGGQPDGQPSGPHPGPEPPGPGATSSSGATSTASSSSSATPGQTNASTGPPTDQHPAAAGASNGVVVHGYLVAADAEGIRTIRGLAGLFALGPSPARSSGHEGTGSSGSWGWAGPILGGAAFAVLLAAGMVIERGRPTVFSRFGTPRR